MPNYVSRPYVETGVSYTREFRFVDNEHAGFSFDCDENGVIEFKNEWGEANYQKCLDGTYEVEDLGIQAREWRHRVPGVILCDCEHEVTLGNFTNTCYECGADYNSRGNRLAPRSQWGEETGEHWTECY
jgi:hypothetical protein